MSTEKDKLLARQTKIQQQLQKAQQDEKRIKKQLDELERKERTHRLCTRGAYLEKLLQEPELLTDEDVFRFLDNAFSTPYVKDDLRRLLDFKHQKAAAAAKSNAEKLTD